MKTELRLSNGAVLRPLTFFMTFAVLVSTSCPVWAVPVPLRSTRRLSLLEEPVVYRVKTAKLILVDYELLRRDFPTLLKDFSNSQIDDWLLQNAALIAKTQVDLGTSAGLNDPIDVDTTQPIQALRPIDYGRGLVFKVGSNGTEDLLIDAKGTGATHPKVGDTPFQRGHSDGLGTLSEMIREYAIEKLVHKIFIHSKSGFDTIESYAVLDLGFKASRFGSWPNAGMILRQAHKRYITQSHYQLLDATALKAEKIMRQYGLSSTGMGYPRNIGLTERAQNIQGSEEDAIVDFGPYIAVKNFDSSMYGMDDFSYGRILLDRNSPDFIQPNPDLCVTLGTWGVEFDTYYNQHVVRTDDWINRWMAWISSGVKTKEDFTQYLNGLYDVELERWKKYDSKMEAIQPTPTLAPAPSPTTLPGSDTKNVLDLLKSWM